MRLSWPLILAHIFVITGCTLGTAHRTEPDIGTVQTTGEEQPMSGRPALRHGDRVALVLGGTGVASFATVGLLKKLYEEDIEIDFIVATGWPALFALASTFLKSIHDVEWFATRLSLRDFERIGSVDFRTGIDPTDALEGIILQSFQKQLLNQGRLPVVIAATHTDLGEPDVFGSGSWKEPLLRTLSVPGLFRGFPQSDTAWIDRLRALDVRESIRRGGQHIIALSMYDDFLQWLIQKPGNQKEQTSQRLYANQIRKTADQALQSLAGGGASVGARVVLHKAPLDFGAKRAAILAGYRQGTSLIKRLREPAPGPTED